MPQILVDFYNDLLTKNYFALAAVTIMILTQVIKTVPWLQQQIWAKIPTGWRYLVPIVLSMAAAFVHGFLTGETLSADLWDVVRIALGAMGGNAALTESVLPWGGGPGGVKFGARKSSKATTFYVDPNHTGPESGGLHAPFTTIAAAMRAADPVTGATIVLAPNPTLQDVALTDDDKTPIDRKPLPSSVPPKPPEPPQAA